MNQTVILSLFINTTWVSKLEEEKAETQFQNILLAYISHELRTPLNIITGMVNKLLKEGMEERQLKSLNAINAFVRQLTTVIDDIIDMQRFKQN